jgi:hypothetical protein
LLVLAEPATLNQGVGKRWKEVKNREKSFGGLSAGDAIARAPGKTEVRK